MAEHLISDLYERRLRGFMLLRLDMADFLAPHLLERFKREEQELAASMRALLQLRDELERARKELKESRGRGSSKGKGKGRGKGAGKGSTGTGAASRAPASTGAALGTTVVSLGSATEPGLWLKTPLVDAEQPGRVTNPATGKSAAVTLIPLEGPATAGSRMSLPALRLIGASLTDLTTVEVSTEG